MKLIRIVLYIDNINVSRDLNATSAHTRTP